MSSYLKRVMLPDEKIVYETELHWVIYLSGFLVVMAGVLVAQSGSHFAHAMFGDSTAKMLDVGLKRFAALLIIVGAVKMLWAFVRQVSTELVVTNYRVISKFGFIATTTFELMMTKVEGANIDQSVWGRILGFGTVMVKGTGGGISPIDHIANPTGFQTNLLMALERAQSPTNANTAPMRGAARNA